MSPNQKLYALFAAGFFLVNLGCGEAPTTTGESPSTPTVEATPVGFVDATPEEFTPSGAKVVSFEVPTMHCEFMCAPKVRQTLGTQPGVVDVDIDLDTKTARVAVAGEGFDAEKAIAELGATGFPDAKELPSDAAEAPAG